uniref:(California timema) hypothetical protein n=1 Tax=Timema californicum TaxID=61474 RepID=A0A7R9PBL5_TIMCA|nr:unnamed protein product [Timema californicum]
MERSLTTTCLFPVPRLLLRVLQRYLYDMFHCYNGIILRSDEKEENTPNEIMDYNSPFTLDEVTYNLYQVGSTGSDDVHNEKLRQLHLTDYGSSEYGPAGPVALNMIVSIMQASD